MMNATAHTHVLVEQRNGTAIVTMNRPERRNALSLELMRELTAAFEDIGRDTEIHAVVLRGEGPAFSSGHDLRELVGRDAAAYREIFDACVVLMECIQRIPQPVIAEVASVATAAGCQLVATCDLAVAAPEATFATPGVRIGLFCSTPMVALARIIGRRRALEMLLTGRPITAQTAADWGLVNAVVPQERLHEAALELAEQIGSASGRVVAIGKAAFYAQIDLPGPSAYGYTKEVMSRNALEEDAQEGIAAFLGKRPPVWVHPEL